MSSNADQLYHRIEEDPKYRKGLFRQALQDPQGALKSICDIGDDLDLPVSVEEVKEYLARLDDTETKQWLIKARGGL